MLKPKMEANTHWDTYLSQQPRAHILQSTAWGKLKAENGWQQEQVLLRGERGSILAGVQLLFRRLPALPYTLAYLAMGPVGRPSAQSQLWPLIHQRARSRRAAFLKWEPDFSESIDFEPLPGFRPATQSVQPLRTILLDIGVDEETILARMNQGTRRKIRRSIRALTFREGNFADIPRFYSLLADTARRNDFSVHPLSYYQHAANLFLPDQAALILAEDADQLLAGVMVFAQGTRAWYFYGGSSLAARSSSAGYGLQWRAIQWARARGCLEYDFWGVPDEEEETLEAQFTRRKDGLWGVYAFKRGWGGTLVRRPGTWDYVYSPIVYHFYHLAYALQRRIRM